VHWNGREFLAARIIDERPRHPRKLVWATMTKMGDPVYLPPAGKEEEWGTEPVAFRPADLATWGLPLPAPIRVSEKRFTSERVQFALVDEAEVADLAREMERDRADAARGNVSCETRIGPELQPWRNIYRVVYARPIEPTELCGEARVMRALCYDRLIKVGHRQIKTNAGSVAAYGRVSDVPAAEDLTHDWRPPFQPDPRDIRDYEDVISPAINEYGWSRKEEDILRSRAIDPPFSFKELGDHYRKSGEWARLAYWGAIQGICSAANGVVFSNARAKLERVQEGNRRAKREARA
jgi:hypothetical protein